MRALAAGSGIAALALLAWLVAGGGWSAVTYRYQQAELAAALPALQLTEALASLRVANEQARAGAPVSGPLLAVTPADEWFARPVDERWADYQSAEWRPVRRLTRGYVGLLALLLFGRPLVKGLWYLLMLAATRRTAGPGISHGSARWATPGEARRLRPRPGRTDLVVGRVGRRPVSVPEEEQYEHLLLVAPTGAGKTSGVIIPNLLREPGARSLVITDPKRELLRATAPALRWRYGDANVWALDFLDPALSLGYNPLAYVRDAATADVFAQTWVANTGTNSKDVFWENAARTLIAAAALHLVRTDE
ncbi:MAG TPA: type IV secretory system conjugative DNA transfer family protein, partial [Thermomicrobiales bacterium]|nr:type IV secretory system conjugative DNA transfer family protein [Thermomicrobiales bacterium]